MRFTLKYLALRASVRKDIFWKIYSSEEIQKRKSNPNITNFPILSPQDVNYDYIYAYLKEWVEKKYRGRDDITIRKVDDREYLCETKKCSRFSKILEAIYKDFKQVFLSRLVKKEPAERQQKAAPKQKVGQPDALGLQKQPEVGEDSHAARQELPKGKPKEKPEKEVQLNQKGT
ncbi:hypothetical protein F0310_04465 (plasmid) [Borrelia sp. A-FGy1]|uniref:hypothetical protein n=1 Tax=Borrelia sp. A-FGy1 TaxID=2608247 RepID=UPI0015F44ADC|nr:hypothetical protein [Borrelia sp. A-FGy1]QMU99667.1 hypothetical protein F0310_04465 [Borrelia sp. A-FGy1]